MAKEFVRLGGCLIMNEKEARRAAAVRKAKRQKTIIFTVCALAGVAVLALFILDALRVDNTRVFVGAPNQVVSLHEDGTFTARLPHGVTRTGAFTEQTEDGVTQIAFTSGRTTDVGYIEGNVLTLPLAWDDGCGHGRELTLR